MSKARFQIAFEGAQFDDGEIDVRDLAPTLLAFGAVVQAANKALNGERADARLKVAATKEGSFVAMLTTDVSWLSDMLDVVAAYPDRVVAADKLMDLIIKAGTVTGGVAFGGIGLIAALKKLRGKRPDKVTPKGDGTTELTINATTLVVGDEVVKLLMDAPTREAVEALGRRAQSVKGLSSLRLGQDTEGEEALRLGRKDFPSMNILEETEETHVETTHRVAWLRIVSSHFQDGYKWRFTDGGERPFTAEMEDVEFKDRVQDGQATLNANDAIKCSLREEQSISGTGLSKVIFVEKVIEHRPGSRQMNLL